MNKEKYCIVTFDGGTKVADWSVGVGDIHVLVCSCQEKVRCRVVVLISGVLCSDSPGKQLLSTERSWARVIGCGSDSNTVSNIFSSALISFVDDLIWLRLAVF